MLFQQNNKKNKTPKNNFFLVVFMLFFALQPSFFSQKKYVVVLDAGHGGRDSGNSKNNYLEKKIALKVALLVGQNLKKNKNITVKYTRTTDVFVDLWKRGDIANNGKANLFVSIHCDSHTSNAYGAGSFVLGMNGNRKNLEIAKRENAVILMEENYKNRYEGFDVNSAESMIGLSFLQEENLDKSLQIASLLQANFSSKLKRHNRQVKQENFQVLRETIMPSVLVELGFLSNKKEGKYLNSKKGQAEMAKEIANSIKKYFEQLRLNTVVDSGKAIKKITKKVAIEYKVLLATVKRKIAVKSYNFKGFRNVERVKEGLLYRYYYGKTSRLKTVKKSLKKAKKKGYKTAYLVAFKNGKRISVIEAKKIQQNN